VLGFLRTIIKKSKIIVINNLVESYIMRREKAAGTKLSSKLGYPDAYINTYTSIYIHTETHTKTHIHTHTHIHMYIYRERDIYISLYMYKYIYMRPPGLNRARSWVNPMHI